MSDHPCSSSGGWIKHYTPIHDRKKNKIDFNGKYMPVNESPHKKTYSAVNIVNVLRGRENGFGQLCVFKYRGGALSAFNEYATKEEKLMLQPKNFRELFFIRKSGDVFLQGPHAYINFLAFLQLRYYADRFYTCAEPSVRITGKAPIPLESVPVSKVHVLLRLSLLGYTSRQSYIGRFSKMRMNAMSKGLMFAIHHDCRQNKNYAYTETISEYTFKTRHFDKPALSSSLSSSFYPKFPRLQLLGRPSVPYYPHQDTDSEGEPSTPQFEEFPDFFEYSGD